jgi:hypothetical protein
MGLPNKNANRRTIVFASALPVFIGAMTLVLWANDVRKDRKHTVTVNEPTPIFAGSGHGCDTRQQMTVVQRGAVLSVRRIRYWKDCATIDVNSPDSQLGHIVLGVGAVEVQPPLP